MKQWESILRILPSAIKIAMGSLSSTVLDKLEELRIRAMQPLAVMCGEMLFVRSDGTTSRSPSGAYLVTQQDCQILFKNMTGYSMYAVEQQLAQCFLTLECGVRVGLAGNTVSDEKGNIRLLKDCMHFNIRFPREVRGCAEEALRYIVTSTGIRNTLVISPPRAGKTTLLRDMARGISGSIAWPQNVCLIDERGELAACKNGLPQFDVGVRTDVLDGCRKADGMLRMIRTMAPDVIITDEIGSAEDSAALSEAANCGVSVIASAHGSGIEDITGRAVLHSIVESGFFDRYIILGRQAGPGTLLSVLDGKCRTLYSRSERVSV